MVDFAALRAKNKAAIDASIEAAPPARKNTALDRAQHLIKYHLGEMTEWESNFLYNNISWLRAEKGLSPKAATKLLEIEEEYCGTGCIHKQGESHGH